MLKQLPGIVALLGGLLLTAAGQAGAQAPAALQAPPRVVAMYTTWDRYYFYAGFEVDDRNVISTNRTPDSEPQQDDDIEVFFETDDARANIRTPQTYQMAVSAGNGAYFSVGDNTKIPKAELVYTYKYAATVDGTLNNPNDVDVGYTIELAIPWAELGQSGPPANGATWGFNVISRNRQSLDQPADEFFSLSPRVKTGADVQDPAKWTKITFTNSGQAPSESAQDVICPHTTLGNYPTIDGQIVSGKWPSSSRLSFGTTPISAPAPTVAQEPNTKRSPFSTLPQVETAPTPAPVAPAAPPVAPPAQTAQVPQTPTSIDLPNGGSIKIVPGGIKHPAGFTPPTQVASAGGPFTNPLSPKIPLKYQAALEGDSEESDIAPRLDPPVPPKLLMALYRLDYNGDRRKALAQNVWDAHGQSALMNQPINGCGPWFSGLRPLWHRQQLADMRRAGIEVALLQINPDDPLAGRELDALVEALKEMKFAGKDYPLIGEASSTTQSARANALWQAHIPAEFRADVTAAEVAGAFVVSPGGREKGSLVARDTGNTYQAAWQKALAAKPNDVLIDSWNNFTDGTELAASRQYGESYVDDTRLQANAFNGNQQWHAVYLKEYVPRVIQTQTLYQVPIRVENAGTLPWRAGEQYSLCARWYTPDGRIADNSAPRIPIGQDVLPGRSITLSLGIAARNGYGGNLRPGRYILVIDIVQGQDRWFTFAGDAPLQIPVRVVAAGAPSAMPQATFLGTTTPTSGASGETVRGEVAVRNDGPQPWTQPDAKAGYTLSCKIDSVAPDGTLTEVGQMKGQPLSPVSVLPGEVARPFPNLTLTDAHGHPLPPGDYELHWFVQDTQGKPVPGRYDESLEVTASNPGVSFVLSDIPRQMNAGQTVPVTLALQNLSGRTWPKTVTKIGYHWYYLDGRTMQWNGGLLSPLTADVLPDKLDGDQTAKVQAPDQPGRYSLVWDVQEPNGTWASLSPASKGNDLLQTVITVTGRGPDVPVSLSKDFNASTANFDGQGDGWPQASLPPDGTAEIVENPLEMVNIISAKPGPPLYPNGYYASDANHALPFLYPRKPGPDAIACQGQTIALPGGNYHTVHLLAAVSGTQSVTATFTFGAAPQTVTISPWTATAPAGGSVAFRSPGMTTGNGLTETPITLGDYALPLAPGQRADSLTLPNAPAIKILAITMQK